MKIYPEAPKDPKAEAAVDERQLAADMIAIVESSEKELTPAAIKSRAMAGRDIPHTADRVLREVAEESAKMWAVNPSKFTKEADYVAELEKVKRDLDPEKFVAGVKAAAGVSSFSELLEKLTPIEEIIEEEPKP